MAKRTIGNLNVSIRIDDSTGEHYFCRVSIKGTRTVWSGRVGAPRAGFGAGVAYDSTRAYDAIAQAALSFASCPVGDETEAERETMRAIASELADCCRLRRVACERDLLRDLVRLRRLQALSPHDAASKLYYRALENETKSVRPDTWARVRLRMLAVVNATK